MNTPFKIVMVLVAALAVVVIGYSLFGSGGDKNVPPAKELQNVDPSLIGRNSSNPNPPVTPNPGTGVLQTREELTIAPLASPIDDNFLQPAPPSTIRSTTPTTLPDNNNRSSTIVHTQTNQGGQPRTSAPVPTPNVGARTYAIKAGDTFSSIAKALYGKSSYWTEIAKANPDVNPDNLRIGTVIKLPDITPSTAAAPTPHQPSQPTTPTPAGSKTHTVALGETLWSIAANYYHDGSKWDLIFKANTQVLSNNPDSVRPGMKLVIPPAPTPGSGTPTNRNTGTR